MQKRMAAAAAALLMLSCAPAGDLAMERAPDGQASGILLIGNKGEDTLSFVDLADGRELGRAPTGRMPHEVAVSPDGKRAAVVVYGGSSIDVFDIATRRKLRSIELSPHRGPHGLVWLPDGRLVVTAERSRTLAIVDPARGDRVSAVPTDQEGTHMVAVSPDGRRAYTANIGAGTVSVIDLAAGRKLRDLPVGGRPEAITLTPDGRTLWVGDLEGARVSAWDTARLERVATVPTGAVPIRVAASPDGRWIVTSNFGAGTLTVIDAQTMRPAREIEVSGSREAEQVTILFSPDGRLIYAAETGRNQVAEIDFGSGELVRRINAGRQGDGLAIAR